LRARAERLKKEVEDLKQQLSDKKADLDLIDQQIVSEVRSVLDGPEKEFAAAEEDMKQLAGTSDRYAKTAAQRGWSTGDTLRSLPIPAAFGAPNKIKQTGLPDLPIDSSFRGAPRYDRCTTCHLGMDRANFEPAPLARLGDEDENNRLTAKLQAAKEELEK